MRRYIYGLVAVLGGGCGTSTGLSAGDLYGTWTVTSGAEVFRLDNGNVQTNDLKGAKISLAPVAEGISVADIDLCVLKFELHESTATLMAGQKCSVVVCANGGVETWSSYTLRSSDMANMTLTSTSTIASDGEKINCKGSTSAVLIKTAAWP